MRVFYIRQGHTLPKITATLLDTSGNALSIPLGASVTFRMRAAGGGDLKVDELATIVDANAGKVSYQFTSADSDTVGNYYIDWLYEYLAGKQAVPVNTYNLVVVLEDLG